MMKVKYKNDPREANENRKWQKALHAYQGFRQ